MTREELIEALNDCAKDPDTESRHKSLDDALLFYINDYQVSKLFNSIAKWYS